MTITTATRERLESLVVLNQRSQNYEGVIDKPFKVRKTGIEQGYIQLRMLSVAMGKVYLIIKFHENVVSFCRTYLWI